MVQLTILTGILLLTFLAVVRSGLVGTRILDLQRHERNELPNIPCDIQEDCTESKRMLYFCEDKWDNKKVPRCSGNKCHCEKRDGKDECSDHKDCEGNECKTESGSIYKQSPYCVERINICSCDLTTPSCRNATKNCEHGAISDDNFQTCKCGKKNPPYVPSDPGSCERHEDCSPTDCHVNIIRIHRACRKGRCKCEQFAAVSNW